jgi:hypothetical protein
LSFKSRLLQPFDPYFTARHSLLQGGQLSEHVLLVVMIITLVCAPGTGL